MPTQEKKWWLIKKPPSKGVNFENQEVSTVNLYFLLSNVV
jgi:hypothetical protein